MMTKTSPIRSLPDRRSTPRRRATVLILVMAILGILFVTGVAFMATMSFESEMVRNERETADTGPAVEKIIESVDTFLSTEADQVIDKAAGLTTEQPDTALSRLSPVPFAEAPGVFNTYSPVEPFIDRGTAIWPWFTDVEAMSGIATDYLDSLQISCEWKNGILPSDPEHPADLIPVDADGDGIVDTYQVNAERLGFKRRQIDGLARVLNSTSRPKGSVYIGLRVVPHGGMVNLSYSHPLLIRELFSMSDDEALPQEADTFEPYSPLAEEASMRRRGGMLLPRDLPPSRILGSASNRDVETFGADFPQLYWRNDTVTDHRYWPFQPLEEDTSVGEGPLWQVRMNAAKASLPRDPYDRRHLVTSISYDDNLRRATMVRPVAGAPKKDLVDWIVESKGASAPVDFPYANYPELVENIYTGTDGTFDALSWDVCFDNDDVCDFNPRKGRLRLSLQELDKINDPTNPANPAVRLIQDVFTLMLLQARGDEFGFYTTPEPLNSGSREWQPDFKKIGEAAAMLTANMIDFMDADIEPTPVTVRNADYTSDTFGQEDDSLAAPQVFYGVEIQPFITEAAAKALDNGGDGVADSTKSSYAIELFNPYDETILLRGYFLVIDSTTNGGVTVVPFGDTDSIPRRSFQGFYWDIGVSDYPGAKPMANLDFAAGSVIKLVRQVAGVNVVVDEFDLAASLVGEFDDQMHSFQRNVSATGDVARWYATSPDAFEATNETIGDVNQRLGVTWQPVQVKFASTDQFSTSFPTTGSLLLLMRYANSANKAFTSHLVSSGSHPIDDGRMPVYDLDALNRVRADDDPTRTSTGALGDSRPVGTPESTKDRSGVVEHLPWGQLVFDYFTALPLSNGGPFADYSSDPLQALHENQPRVDLDGMRVHGRINLNAAPWFVLKGLPFIPMNLVPSEFRQTFMSVLLPPGGDPNKPQPIGPARAKAIVAYREQREITQGRNQPYTGDYGDDAVFGRGWKVDNPLVRRGMGYLTVGELANVRHPGAQPDSDGRLPRFDGGIVNPGVDADTPYLEAIAALACLSDWVSVRSQVFTVYGSMRGDVDLTIEDPDATEQDALRAKDADSRAVRFQQTIDRLPTFLGTAEPSIIGNRVIASYMDVRNDY